LVCSCCIVKLHRQGNRQVPVPLSVLEEFFSVDEITYTSIEELAEFIDNKNKGKFECTEDIAKMVQKAARSLYRLLKTVADSVNKMMAISYNTIKTLKDQLKLFDNAIEEVVKTIPHTLTSVKGIGRVYAASIIAEIGEINRFKNQAVLAKYAGICWTKYQSGKYTSENTHMILTVNRYLKYYFIEAANMARMHEPEFKLFYDFKYKNPQIHRTKEHLH